MMTQYAKTKFIQVHSNTISKGELSDPLCDSVNRGLTLVRSFTHLPAVELVVDYYKDLCNLLPRSGGTRDRNSFIKL